MKTTLLAHRIHHFTPWAAWRHPRDHFKPLVGLLLAIMAMDVVVILHWEALYREEAASRKASPLNVNGPVERFSPEPGAVVVGQRNGQPVLNF